MSISRSSRRTQRRAERSCTGRRPPPTSTASCASSRAKYGVRKAVKSKSMVSEECALNDALEAAGVEVVETDLGEYILQLAKEPPSHIIAPVDPQDARRSFRSVRGEAPAAAQDRHRGATREARQTLRPHFSDRRHGHLRREFHGRRNRHHADRHQRRQRPHDDELPRVHVAITGIEKVVPTLEDVALCCGSCRARRPGSRSPTTFHLPPARRARGHRGPEHFHIILVDAGRTKADRQRHAGDAALHSLRRVHEPLPGLPERRRTCLRLGLSRADGLDSHARLRGHRERARPAACIHALQSVRGRVSG